MEKFIPYEKLSKKAKRELDAKRRGSWGALNPVTRRPENPKAYNRQKTKRQSFEDLSSSFCFSGPDLTAAPARLILVS